MFPNVRLMIVAVLASMMGISCALGLFAEFRVSRDSFLRESNAAAPLQLAAGGPPAIAMNAVATFGVRFEAQQAAAAAEITADVAGSRQADPAVAVGTSGPPSSPGQEPAPTAMPAASGPAPPVTAPEQTATKAAPAPTVPLTAPEQIAAPASPTPAAPVMTTPEIAAAPATPSATSDPAAEAASPAASNPIPSQDGSAGNPQREPQSKPGAAKPADNLAERTPAASIAGEEAAPDLKIAPDGARPAAAIKRTIARHRPAIARRTARTRTVSSAPTFTGAQLYQWTASGQSAQPVRRRLAARRPRPVSRSAQPPQAAISDTPATNPPE